MNRKRTAKPLEFGVICAASDAHCHGRAAVALMSTSVFIGGDPISLINKVESTLRLGVCAKVV